ncbi:helix-turn-helix domain-containing protein [Paludibacterium yongneupense]|uniref:helix-turn-helix domain-containing protein n=1 Tax=Paludibacterium yongneupense TaxID=400061 RepID=UPI000405D939|nr:helix-turn-helix transcriptional regulator [Paludibacterium yongneupense]
MSDSIPSALSATLSLGRFLRAVRERLRPEQVGLPAGLRRRAPGLRREEAASLCGISPTWYTWIEQGRSTAISVATLSALADGLRLTPAERAYLFGLAERADPEQAAPAPNDEPRLRLLVDAVASPAYLLDRHWDAVCWNAAAAELFSAWLGPESGSGARRNLLDYVFLDPEAKALIADWDERARRLVAEYRADSAHWHGDPVCLAHIGQLDQASTDFAAAWRSQQVMAREGGRRRFHHPLRGDCEYLQYTLRVAQQPDLKLIVLVAS